MSILMYPLIVHFSLAMRAGGVKKFKSREETKEGFPNLLYSKGYLTFYIVDGQKPRHYL